MVTPYQAAVLADQPTHFVPLDDPAGSVTARNLGTAATPWTPTGVTFGASLLGQAAATFTDTAKVVGPAKILEGQTSWTVELLYQPAPGIASRASAIGPARSVWRIGTGADIDSPIWGYHGGVFSGGADAARAISSWKPFHYVITYDGVVVRGYSDGVAFPANGVTGPVPVEATPPAIGKNDADPGWVGQLSSVAIYPGKVLTAAQIEAHRAALEVPRTADIEDFATAVGGLIKGRSPVGHKHARIESGTGRVLVDASGGVQHWNGDTRRWWIDGDGELVTGTVPWERITGAPESGADTHRLDSDLGYLVLDTSGGLQHGTTADGRVWWVNGQGELQQGTVPWDRVTGAVGMPGHMAVWGSSTAEGIAPEVAAAHKRFGVAVHDKGAFGEWSGQTLFRVVPTTVTVEGGSIPATGTVRITATVLNGEARNFLPTMGYLAGVYGQVRGYGYPGATGGNYYIFERDRPGDAVTTTTAEWVPENPEPAQMNVWLGGGKNDINGDGRTDTQYNTMIANRDAAVAYWQAQGSDVLVVSGFINYGTPTGSRARTLLDQEAADAAAKYPGRYLNIQDLIAGGDVWDWTGITPTDDDLAAQAARTLPPSLTGTGNHFNDAGDAYVAHKISEWLTINGHIGAGSIPFAGPPAASADRVQSLEDRLAPLLYDSGIRSITGQNLASGNIHFQAKNGWCYLDLTSVNLSGAGGNTIILPNNGQLSGYAPSSPMQGKGQVTEVNTSRSYRIVVSYWGGVTIYGAPVGTVLNGYAIWPLNRPIPAMPPGDPT